MHAATIEESISIEEIFVEGYEKVFVVRDPKVALHAIICIHNTQLGPALGGIRIYPYSCFEDALTDVKRLAFSMTYKSALAETGLGGGKSVIISSPEQKSEEMLISFAKAIDHLGGLYTGAEDVGCSLEDVTLIGRYTPYVVGTSRVGSSGNPSFFTAWGTFRGIQATFQILDGSSSVEGKTIAIQGLGSVGMILAETLFWHGAHLIVADIDSHKAQHAVKNYGATLCTIEEITQQSCDIFAPCALGGVLNPHSISQLSCRGVAGCANNQLLAASDAEELQKRNIFYAPDFVINAGGLINVTQELDEKGYDPQISRKKSDQTYDQILQLAEMAQKNHCTTYEAAFALGDYKIKYRVAKRTIPPRYHHFYADR